MSFQVNIRQVDEPITVEMGETILAAALKQGLDFPHSCQSGNCGACKCRLHEGDVEMTPYSEFALSEQEKENGLILACRAVPWEDCDVSWLGDEDRIVHPQRDMDCEVTAVERMTHDIVAVRVKVLAGGPYSFSAGQYAEMIFEGLPSRQYSMANRPDQSELEFHIRVVPGGEVSTYANERLGPGTKVRIKGPGGTAYWRETHQGPVLAVAGGSGLAPIKSIVESVLREGFEHPIHFYFGVRDERDLYMTEEFEALAAKHPNLSFTPVLSEPSGETARRTGFVTDAVKADLKNLEGYRAYLCGPPPMVEAGATLAREMGVLPEHVYADAFYTEAEKKALEAA